MTRRPVGSGEAGRSLRAEASIDEIVGLLKVVARLCFGCRVSLADLAASLVHDDEKLVELLEAIQLLGFAELSQGWVRLTPVGRQYARAAEHDRRLILAEQLTARVPRVADIRRRLEHSAAGQIKLAEIETELCGSVETSGLARSLQDALAWARYAGLFSFDVRTGTVFLKTPGHPSDI